MMKKIIAIFLLGLFNISVHADMKVIQDRLNLISHIANNATAKDMLQGGNNNLSYHVNWPGSEDINQALLMINWDGFPAEDLSDVLIQVDTSGPVRLEHKLQGIMQSWLFLPLDTRNVTLRHPKYGSAQIALKAMNQHDVWEIPVVVDNLLNIEIKPLTDYNKPVRVTLVNPETGAEIEALSPAVFEKVLPGVYDVRFAINGRNEQRQITVSPSQKVFGGANFDFRHTKPVTLESTEKGIFLVDGTFRGEGTIITTDLPYGTHTVTIKVNDNLKDEKTIDVNEASENIIYLSPIQTRTFEVVGLYQGKQVPTRIYVPGLSNDRYTQEEDNKHVFTLPVDGKPYTYILSHQGHSGSKEIQVTKGMNNVQEIKLRADRRMIWPWQREYENVNSWFEFSYVAKQYVTRGRLYEDGSDIKTSIKENGVWDDGYNKWLHGFRLGYHYQPAFKFGLGLYTGLFMEFYFSATQDYPIGVYDKYAEWDLSLPLHILYQMPLGKKFCIGFHTGPSLNYAAVGSYYDKVLPSDDDTDNVEDWTDFWNEPWAPSRFNVDWDFCLFIRWKKFMISGTLSSGMTNNKMHEDFGADAKTVMNKAVIAFSLGF